MDDVGGKVVGLGPGAGGTPTGAGARRRRRWVRWVAGGAGLVIVGAVGVGWAAYRKLDGNITSDRTAADELARFEKERPTALVRGAQNILVIGSDSRAGNGNGEYGRDSGTERSDTTILLHLAADRRSATAVSLPRDLMVEVPSCRRADGRRSEPAFTLFNYAFQAGGSACTIRTVERMTDIRIDHHIVVDFSGFKEMVDAVDGVEVCLAAPIHDKQADLRLPAGRVKLSGEQALGYVRARKSLGDGSDTERMDRQQRFLAALAAKVRGNEVLLNPVKLYPVLDAATSSLTTDPGLASLRGLYDLVRGLRTIPMEKVQFLTVPRKSYAYDANRDELVEPAARRLFARLRADEPLAIARELPGGKREGRTEQLSGSLSGTPDPMPTFRGSTAAEEDCV
ncbi:MULTISPECIES: LCP family protein [Streptomyces]|uniref:LCP family protein required for cell wall assembly n=1 Tax=Streptomyces stelliscabiei TaxID=146820 RepID=A0A8I0P5W6_9ACTN|nr:MULTISPECIES: LCP family protein [Streptomyces]KND44347.1 LytR family transcriptional regulator [Streptomyces stelliscabiei]MBE1597774.1 LCP family protein required for cell wall assembly [Streptomyces stelliscabiei]MDX2515272.1 LCP family protein [Streptomyces stelliscabiei]MDX2551903.1 LCP family protein [Streptomyces stelliscabiei]MDX2609729.1 LCP family protein [Streptomyces stelliscabiei]